MSRVSRLFTGPFAAPLAVLLIAVFTPACNCGGGGVGDPCDSQEDCDPGLACDMASLTCVSITDSATTDAGSDAATTDGGCATPDGDGDGFTVCDGDCDDGDPLTYPGASEACGDGVTNDCLSMDPPDQGCMMMGTFVAPPPLGQPGAAGTPTEPVDTIREGLDHAIAIGGGVDVFIAAGTYNEMMVIDMVDGADILCGFESTNWTRDPAVNVTVINPSNDEGIIVPGSVGAGTEISGCTINGVSSSPADASTISVMNGSSVRIYNNIINGPDAGDRSFAVNLNFGGGANSGTPVVEMNTINNGMGDFAFPGGNFGIVAEETAALITGNLVNFVGDDIVERGIVSWLSVPGLVISNNVVRGSLMVPADRALGIIVGGSGAVVDSNDVGLTMCFQNCTGIALDGIVAATVTNNVSFAGLGGPSEALRVLYENPAGLPPTDLLVHSNTLFAGGENAGNQVTSIGIHLINLNPMNNVTVGRFINNIVDAGIGEFRFAFQENGATIDPDVVEANDLWVDSSGSIIASALYNDEGSNMIMMISNVDALTDTSASMNISADPNVVNPVVGGDWHLGGGSPCIDVGSTTELPPHDFEGDGRPAGAGPDIGADET